MLPTSSFIFANLWILICQNDRQSLHFSVTIKKQTVKYRKKLVHRNLWSCGFNGVCQSRIQSQLWILRAIWANHPRKSIEAHSGARKTFQLGSFKLHLHYEFGQTKGLVTCMLYFILCCFTAWNLVSWALLFYFWRQFVAINFYRSVLDLIGASCKGKPLMSDFYFLKDFKLDFVVVSHIKPLSIQKSSIRIKYEYFCKALRQEAEH